MNDRPAVFSRIKDFVVSKGLHVADEDQTKPWGGALYLSQGEVDHEIEHFIKTFFPTLELDDAEKKLPMRPKILLVAPGMRLSWQYHNHRAEIWRIIEGPVGVMVSDSDDQKETDYFQTGDLVRLAQGVRHRLVGLEKWGIIAEIWQHTTSGRPSNEDDVIRLHDDFGR